MSTVISVKSSFQVEPNGFNSLKAEECHSAVSREMVKKDFLETSTYFKLIGNKSDYFNSTSFEGAMGAEILPAGAINVQTSLNASTTNSHQNNSLWCVLHCRALLKVETAENVKMHEKANDLLRLERDQFFRQYGDSYISQIGYGKEIIVFVEIHLNAEQRKKILKANLQGKFVAAASIKSSIQKETNQKLEDIKCTFYLEQAGTNITLPENANCEELYKWISKLPGMLKAEILDKTIPLKQLWYRKEFYDKVPGVYYPGACEIREIIEYAWQKLNLIDQLKQFSLQCRSYIKSNWNGRKEKEADFLKINQCIDHLTAMAKKIRNARFSEIIDEIIATKENKASAEKARFTLQQLIDTMASIHKTLAMYQAPTVLASHISTERRSDQNEVKFGIEKELLKRAEKIIFLLYTLEVHIGYKDKGRDFLALTTLGEDYEPLVDPNKVLDPKQESDKPVIRQAHVIHNLDKHREIDFSVIGKKGMKLDPKDRVMDSQIFIPMEIECLQPLDSPAASTASKLAEKSEKLALTEKKEHQDDKKHLDEVRLALETSIQNNQKRVWQRNSEKAETIRDQYSSKLRKGFKSFFRGWIPYLLRNVIGIKTKQRRAQQLDFVKNLTLKLQQDTERRDLFHDNNLILLGSIQRLQDILVEERGDQPLNNSAYIVINGLLTMMAEDLLKEQSVMLQENREVSGGKPNKVDKETLLRFSTEKYQRYMDKTKRIDFPMMEQAVFQEFRRVKKNK